MANITQWYATGRRKESVARVFLRPGTGRIVVNKKPMEDYFERKVAHYIVLQPMQLTESVENVDVYATVNGGGKAGQPGARKRFQFSKR